MPSDATNVDAALVGKLEADSTLMALVPDGIYIDVGWKNATRFVIVSQLAHEDDYMFGGSAYESFEYLVKAVILSTTGTNIQTAAARIHTLLQDGTLTPTGYTKMVMQRLERIRYVEVDDDTDARWQHCGGRYQIMVSP